MMVKKFKGTPGYWSYNGNPHGFVMSDSKLLAAVYPIPSDYPGASEEMMANCNVIVAAPLMLKTLQDLVDLEGPQPGNAAWAIQAQAAIDKALGK